jgi:hypothetical protein
MVKAATVGPDIAKQVFQAHEADKTGEVVLRRKLRPGEVARFYSEQPPCLVGIEASGSATLLGEFRRPLCLKPIDLSQAGTIRGSETSTPAGSASTRGGGRAHSPSILQPRRQIHRLCNDGSKRKSCESRRTGNRECDLIPRWPDCDSRSSQSARVNILPRSHSRTGPGRVLLSADGQVT